MSPITQAAAVVTGAASGLGRAIAHRFAKEGIKVALWDLDLAGAKRVGEEIGEGAQAFAVDVTDTKSVRAAWSATKQALGAPSILVNSAGILGPSAGIASYPEEQWHRVLDINLSGTFRCCQAAVPDMVAGGYGRIVNIASIAGKDGNPNVAAYVASKAAVIALTKSMGKELATSGVLVNAITPSASETAIFGDLTDERRAKLLANVPMARMVRPEEVAEMAFWLSSPACSFSTGAVFDISGGRATY
ncbi:MAG: SDR family oxidoreductase [Reyranella sp.]|uniref:SDR family NAD(P)-dependent oxidoreductase n=1 Tax=Reyranella sp. TaxID=1929291 RepID=UPI001207C2BA|nr:SDR family NAD(P)-dependent oxidoreductase [Reyranella sp.]TAJ96086.1 MAG: SDR family oxidoreductase [Reyranella sp.]